MVTKTRLSVPIVEVPVSNQDYLSAGVDEESAANIVQSINALARITHTSNVLNTPGGFAGLYELKNYNDPVLVSSTDGVGTKLKIANVLGHFESLGVDLVNQNVNDILTSGARPLFFLDYISMGRLDPQQIENLVRGMSWACREVECALVGGELSQQPGVYLGDDFDLAGFVVGVVEKSRLLDGSTIQAGDMLLGLPSSGLHTNGFSLVRQVFNIKHDHNVLYSLFPELGHSLGEELLIPHRSYYRELEPLFDHVKGIAHITGGGIPGNLPRILPDALSATIDPQAWSIPPIFNLIQQTGKISSYEMYKVFNMGIGMILVCDPTRVNHVKRHSPEIIELGEVSSGKSTGERIIIKGITGSDS